MLEARVDVLTAEPAIVRAADRSRLDGLPWSCAVRDGLALRRLRPRELRDTGTALRLAARAHEQGDELRANLQLEFALRTLNPGVSANDAVPQSGPRLRTSPRERGSREYTGRTVACSICETNHATFRCGSLTFAECASGVPHIVAVHGIPARPQVAPSQAAALERERQEVFGA